MVVTRRDHIKKIPKFEPFEVLTILCEDYVLSFFVTFCNSIISLRERGGETYTKKLFWNWIYWFTARKWRKQEYKFWFWDTYSSSYRDLECPNQQVTESYMLIQKAVETAN